MVKGNFTEEDFENIPESILSSLDEEEDFHEINIVHQEFVEKESN